RALREGLQILEAQGRIWRHVGKGTFVSNPKSAEGTHLEELSARTSPAEVLEVRLLIEPLVARLAATRATASEIDQMKRLLEKGSKARHPAVWEGRDISLHRAVAQAAHNAFLLTIFDLFNDMRKQPTWGALRSASLTSERVKLY